MLTGRVAACAAMLSCAAMGGGVALAAGGDPPNPIPAFAPENQAATADVLSWCAVPPRSTFAVTRTIRGSAPDGGREVTEIGHGGMYRVSRCDDNGALRFARVMAPIRVPGGGTEVVPVEDIKVQPDGTEVSLAALYGSPDDPRWVERWEASAERILDGVLPVTSVERRVG